MGTSAITPPTGYTVEEQQTSSLPPGYTIEQDGQTEQQPSEFYGAEASFPQGEPGDRMAEPKEVVKGAAEEAWSQAKGALSSIPGISAFSDIPAEYKAYESARKQGKGMLESAKAASDVIKQRHDALGALKQRFDEFETNPSHALGKAIVDLLPLAIGAGEMAPEAGAEEVAGEATAAKPGLIKQAVKGKEVAQPQAQAALREAAGTESGPLRETLEKPIEAAHATAKDLYKQIDDASGADFKGLAAKLKAANRAYGSSVSDAEDAALEARRAQIEDRIEAAKELAKSKGVDPSVLDEADASFKKMSALTDIQKRVFKNVRVVDETTGSVNIDAATKELQKLQDNTKYGEPRLEQAFGKKGAAELLDKFKDAKLQGIHAMKVQKIAKWIAGLTATAGAYEGVRAVLGKE